MLWADSSTITKCLKLGHFRRFPQVDARPDKWHLSAPRRAGVDGEIPESQFGNLVCWAIASDREVSSLRAKMSATKRVIPFESWPANTAAEIRRPAPGPQPVPAAPGVPALRLAPLLAPTQPRRFVRVPTHAVGVHPEQREYPRATLNLPLRLRGTGGVPEEFPVTLVTRDVSSTGVYFLCPRQLAVGASVELEIVLVSRPLGLGNVVMATMAHVCRTEPVAMPGWYGIAAAFDDVQFDRDDRIPPRYLKP